MSEKAEPIDIGVGNVMFVKMEPSWLLSVDEDVGGVILAKESGKISSYRILLPAQLLNHVKGGRGKTISVTMKVVEVQGSNYVCEGREVFW